MREAREVTSETRLGIRGLEPVLKVVRQKSRFFVGAEESDRVEVASALVASDVAQEILAARAVRKRQRSGGGHTTQGTVAVSIERDHPRMGNVAVVAAEELVAAIAR